MEYLSIKKVKSNPNNPRTITDENFEKLLKSIKEFPKMLELRPLVVDENLVVLGGNMRLKACIEAGLKKVPVLHAKDLNEEEKKRFIIADNVGFGDWNWDSLNNEWNKDELKEWGLNNISWDLYELGDVVLSEDVTSNNSDYKNTDEYAMDYLNSDIKRFEVMVSVGEYDIFINALNVIKSESNTTNNSDAIKYLVMKYSK